MKKKVPTVTEQMIADLKDGATSRFWVTLKRIIQNEKEDINADILAKEDLKLSDSDVTDLIRWHNFLDYVIRLPEKCIESLEQEAVNDGSESQDDGDPYEKLPLQEVRQRIKNK